MAFFIYSDYVCVEAGSCLSDGEDRLVYATREEAQAKYDARRDLLLGAVHQEIGIINDHDHLEFNSPYIVWILMLNLADCESTLAAVDDYLAKCVERRQRPEAFLRKLVERFDGWVFSEKGRKTYAVGEVIDELVEYYS